MMAILKLSELGKPAPKAKPSPRLTSHQRGYNHEWRKYSQQYRRDHPLCAQCRCNPSAVVDHKQPHRGRDDPLFWASSNHQALCSGCHSKKTAKEDGGFGNRRSKRR
jgi:5-methylcytosine-specific restriction enzyme A